MLSCPWRGLAIAVAGTRCCPPPRDSAGLGEPLVRCVRIQLRRSLTRPAALGRRRVAAGPPGEGAAMRTRIFTGRLRRVGWLGTLGALLAVLAVPFIGASSASAYPGFTVSATCTATTGQSGSQFLWDWYQGGAGGTLLAQGSVRCPAI